MKTLSARTLILLVFLLAAQVRGDEAEEMSFDIFDNDGTLSIWLDLSPLLTSKRLTYLKDGIDLAVDCRFSLQRPRRLWGAEKIQQVTGVYRIGYRLVPDDYRLSCRIDSVLSQRNFLSLDDLNRFLADSVTVGLTPIAPLEQNERYYIDIRITCVSLTVLNVAEGDEPTPAADQSPLKWLFEGFLDLTNFGRQDYQLRSRPFYVSELTP